jgi:hypothetical protein
LALTFLPLLVPMAPLLWLRHEHRARDAEGMAGHRVWMPVGRHHPAVGGVGGSDHRKPAWLGLMVSGWRRRPASKLLVVARVREAVVGELARSDQLNFVSNALRRDRCRQRDELTQVASTCCRSG